MPAFGTGCREDEPADQARPLQGDLLGDEAVSLETRDAQVAAIEQWGVPDAAKLERLEHIRVPTLVANGENDVMIPVENSIELAHRIPGARLVLYPDANHGFLFQYPHEFAAEVNTFLGR